MHAEIRLAVVGEAWGVEEAEARLPFVGASGRLLATLLSGIGIERNIARSGGKVVDVEEPGNLLVTNAFNRHPERNEVKRLLGPRKAAAPGWERIPLEKGKYLTQDLLPELTRLHAELAAFRPSVVIALGNTPLWLLARVPGGIMSRRGCWHEISIPGLQAPIPMIPTIHPAFILRKFVWFVLAASDFQKALRLAKGSLAPEAPEIIPRPTLSQVRALRRLKGPIVFDIETLPAWRAISCVGLGGTLAGKPILACVPFVDFNRPGRNYWDSPEDETEAWLVIRDVLEDSAKPKIGQNPLYDVTWLREIAGVSVAGMLWDTRQMHHALWPELPHDLGAIVTSFPDILMPPWKASHAAAKRDD